MGRCSWRSLGIKNHTHTFKLSKGMMDLSLLQALFSQNNRERSSGEAQPIPTVLWESRAPVIFSRRISGFLALVNWRIWDLRPESGDLRSRSCRAGRQRGVMAPCAPGAALPLDRLMESLSRIRGGKLGRANHSPVQFLHLLFCQAHRDGAFFPGKSLSST